MTTSNFCLALTTIVAVVVHFVCKDSVVALEGVNSATALVWVVAIGIIASVGVEIATAAGAFGTDLPDQQFPELDSGAAEGAVDIELQAAQRRANQRRSVLAGGGEDIDVGFATVLGSQEAAPSSAEPTLLGE